ncbi:hypothetical protein QDR37_00820 [Amnibacterium sp. CER49]|uniref:hypothetical protein n=1 Tax=Amnibacterium sp. CER49 TaxID=3039161 RepID=UPI00244D675A|nr:hypothetical protein [Amnibacterium sp. CER49]MDH2442479.1 hypothetical protein [Amnibacterium sp. CER49]
MDESPADRGQVLGAAALVAAIVLVAVPLAAALADARHAGGAVGGVPPLPPARLLVADSALLVLPLLLGLHAVLDGRGRRLGLAAVAVTVAGDLGVLLLLLLAVAHAPTSVPPAPVTWGS